MLRCPKTGCVGPPDELATDLADPRALALDDVSVFYTQAGHVFDGGLGGVMRVAK